MTPFQFEQRRRADWDELEDLLDRLERRRPALGKTGAPARPDAARLAFLYRRACEHLALAQARSYPAALTARLDALAQRAHQAIYRRGEFGLARLARLLLIEFPRRVRQQRGYVLAAALIFCVPLAALGVLTWHAPSFALTVVDVEQLQQYAWMYFPDSDGPIGRQRSADSDWVMFGYYVLNNIGVGFQCFAGGLIAGLGSIFFLAFNGLHTGVIAGYLTQLGYIETFWSFVATHSSFELTAIVLAGAAGLRIGHSVLAPGRRTRTHALVAAARASIVIIYGAIALLLIAAAVEAFWSSSRWIAPEIKYVSGAACWVLLFVFLACAGRGRTP